MLKAKSVRDLFNLYVDVMRELRERSIIQSTNNPIGDYGELLFARALNLSRTAKSTKGHDAVSVDGTKYEVKARRITPSNGSRQLSALRKFEERHFDYLAGVLFNEDFSVWKGCLIPYDVVRENSVKREHTNAWIFQLTDDVWSKQGVRDFTEQLLTVEQEIAQSTGVSPETYR